MKLGKAGWLPNLLAEIATLHQRDAARVPPDVTSSPHARRAAARAYLKAELEERSLIYGAADEELARLPPDSVGLQPEPRLFLGILRSWGRMALGIAQRLGAQPGPRREQLLILLAALMGDQDAARALDGLVRQKKPPSRRQWARVESVLERRAASLAGDPVQGLLLHNGVALVEARLLGQEALDYFQRGTFHSARSVRRRWVTGRGKALLVEVLSALASVDQQPNLATRRAILRQVEGLELPAALERSLRLRLQQTFEGRGELTAALTTMRAEPLRRWLLEQALLSALVQGRSSEAERAFLAQLANALSISSQDRIALENEVSAFYAGHRTLVDAFTEGGGRWRGNLTVASVQSSLAKNFERLMQEVRETGELSVLLTKVARGYRPTLEERRRMRAQLIDLAKAVPALALFAAPGGMLLLIALAKVLPFSLLPSAFQDEPEGRRKKS